MEPIKDIIVNQEQMAIMEKYEKVIDYLYPIAQNIPRKHGVARDKFLETLFKQCELFYEAGKTNQSTKLYIADAGLAHLRFWLRFLAKPKNKCITPHQLKTSLSLVSEVGAMLGAWIIKRKGQNG